MFTVPKNINTFIKSVIDKFEGSDERSMMRVGDLYYRSKNKKIMERKKLMYVRDDAGADFLVEDPYKANNKLAAGYYKILIDQKAQYSLGKPVTIKSADGGIDLLDLLGKKDFPKVLAKVGKAAAKKSIGWAQPYIDQSGTFKLIRIPSEQVIAIYKADTEDEIDYAFRYYPVQVLNKKDELVSVTMVEVWDEAQVTYIRQDPDTKEYKFVETKPHITQSVTYGETTTEQKTTTWGKVPLIPFYNNDERTYDLEPVRKHIDIYDVVESDFANNLEDIQDILWVLKGYNGENLETFLSEVRKYKTLKVSEEGDAHAETVQIPTEAREKLLDRLNDDIFKFGRGVDTSKTGDGNLTNIVIKARFANLDLKASEFETEAKEFIDRVMWFLNKYLEIGGKVKPIADYDVTFNRSQIINETELLESNAAQKGSISEDTRLANHPWVDDVAEEKAKMEAEKPEIKLEDDPDDGEGEGTTGPDGAAV